MSPSFSMELRAKIRDWILQYPPPNEPFSALINQVREFDALPTGGDMSAVFFLKADGTLLAWDPPPDEPELVTSIWVQLVNLRIASKQYPELLQALPQKTDRSVECETCHGRGVIDTRRPGGSGSADWPCWPCGTMGWHNGEPLYPSMSWLISG